MVSYNYDRSKTAASVNYRPSEKYSDALTVLQEQFVGGVAQNTAEYINTTNRRLRKDGDWQYGVPQGRGTGMYSITVFNKSMYSSVPNAITLYFKFDNTIEVYAKADSGEALFKKKVGFSISASSVALSIGEGWERLTTGTVDYGY